MNCILKLWTTILTNIGTHTTKTEGIFNDTADGFRAHRQIYDSLTTHIMMYEDAKLSKKTIYTAYSDFKSAFGRMDRRILFQIMRDYGFHDSYITLYQQLYSDSHTYYKIIHGIKIPIPIHRGALQGDTLSPFIFAIFMEPLIRWLSVGSRDYQPTYQPYKPSSTIITYDDHGYAYDISIPAGNIRYLKIQLKQLHVSSTYTGVQLETSKCEATGALWASGHPLTTTNQSTLQEQINTITFPDGSHIQYPPPPRNHTKCLIYTLTQYSISESTTHTSPRRSGSW